MMNDEQTDAPWRSEQLVPAEDGLIVIGQLGQSLDGQIATSTGQSKYINGEGGLLHLHRLRAWADVVVVGVGTVVADNPQLTVRFVDGQNPARVVVDPRGRTPGESVCLKPASVRRVILTRELLPTSQWPEGVEQVCIGSDQNSSLIDPVQIRGWLAQQGWHRVLVEGGANTLGAFLAADCLDDLHLIMSPVLLGPGVAGVRASAVDDLAMARRFVARAYPLGSDLLMACSFR